MSATEIPALPETADASRSPALTQDALLWNALPELKLNIAQTATLCGISVRQLGYWTKQGYVAATGRGARRVYGLDALRRILAICKAMNDGASLRQSIRALSAAPRLSSVADAAPLLPSAPDLPGEQARIIADSLLALFAAGRHTRDNATGLAIKLGRSEEDVRRVAEALCLTGVLTKTMAQSEIVFRRAPEEKREEKRDAQ